MIRNILKVFVAIFVLANIGVYYRVHSQSYQDDYMRNRVVLLHSPAGSCTGVQVLAPSGITYVLTAAHCRSLLNYSNDVLAQDENKNDHWSHLIAEDDYSDLMLLTSYDTKHVRVAVKDYEHEHIHSMTHGRGMPSFRTDGEILRDDVAHFILFTTMNPKELIKCAMPKYDIVMTYMGLACVSIMEQTFTTAMVIPGSSGGPMVDDNLNLIGIVSTTDGEGLSTTVRLEDIQRFLKDK